MKPAKWLIVRLCALVALVTGVVYSAWIYVKGDTGGAIACACGVLLIVSIILNEG